MFNVEITQFNALQWTNKTIPANLISQFSNTQPLHYSMTFLTICLTVTITNHKIVLQIALP